jgi:DnaJ-class molecular chaperone
MPEQPDMHPGDEVKPGTSQSGEQICPLCQGTGRQDGGDACPDCGGSGKIIALVGDA